MADPQTPPPQAPATGDFDPEAAPSSLWQDAWDRLKQNRLAVVCLWFFLGITVVCWFGPLLSPHDAEAQDLARGAVGPNLTHWMGTDPLGRDLLVRVMEGGRISIMVGFAATVVALTIGIAWGAIAGFSGGKTDSALMRIVDILYALPFMIFVILLTTIFEKSLLMLFVAIGAVEWLTLSRIVRGQVQHLKVQQFVEVARTLGADNKRILWRHLLPNVLGPVIIYSTLTVPQVMLLESALSFLGLGVQPPNASWGVLIKEGAERMETFPWLVIFPSLAFSTTLFALNFLGDGLRDALDPKASGR
ncbi:MAG: ABC transporter permease [Opitutales bacterium]